MRLIIQKLSRYFSRRYRFVLVLFFSVMICFHAYSHLRRMQWKGLAPIPIPINPNNSETHTTMENIK